MTTLKILSSRPLNWLMVGLLLLVIAGIALRIAHRYGSYCFSYNSNYSGHLSYIGFIRDHNGRVPQIREESYIGVPDQYVQEPLFYMIAAMLSDLNQIADFAMILSIMGLLCVFRATFFLSSWIVRYGIVAFWSIDPFFVLHSSSISNDSLIGFAGALFFYCVHCLNRNPTRINYWWVFWTLVLALNSKHSGVVLLVAMPWVLWRSTNHFRQWQLLLWRSAVLAVVVGVWAGYVRHRAWDPQSASYVYANDFFCPSVDVPRKSLIDYFSSFRLNDLVREGHATMFATQTADDVRFSYNTSEYGQFLVASWDYNYCPALEWPNRLLFIFGMIIPVGLFLFLVVTLFGYPLSTEAGFNFLNKTALFLFLVMYIGTGTWIYSGLHLTNADPWLQIATLPWVIYCFTRGWTVFGRSWALRITMWAGLAGFVISCGLYYYVFFTQNQIPFIYY